jgi:hypothetical protein
MELDPAARAQAALDSEYSKEAARKEAFQRYLAQHRVMGSLNTALQELYMQEELPKDPIAFVCSMLQTAHALPAGPGQR